MQKTIIKSLLLIIAFTFALSANYIFAVWTGPTQAPPGGNTPTPIHIGAIAQLKDGPLSLSRLLVAPGSAIDENGIPFTTNGESYLLGPVGIGTTNPQAKLDVVGGINATGKIKLGNDSTAPTAGTIRFTGTDFEGYNGTEWKSLTDRGDPSPAGGCPEGIDRVMFGGASVCLADGASASASCEAVVFRAERRYTGYARYTGGRIQTRVTNTCVFRNNWCTQAYDSGWINGTSASIGAHIVARTYVTGVTINGTGINDSECSAQDAWH